MTKMRLVNYGSIKFRPVPAEELSFALLQLSLLLESGLTLTQALSSLALQVENRRLKESLLEVKASVERGEPFRTALQKTGLFPEFLVEMLRVVERGESLEKILRMGGEYLQKVSETKSRLLTSFAYPSFVVLVSLLSVLVVSRVVVPKVASVLKGLGKELPLLTKALLLFSELLGYFVYLVPVFLLLYVFRFRLIRKEVWDRWLLKLPVVGKVLLYYDLARLSGSLHMALSSGMPVLRAVSFSISSMSNAYLRESLRHVEAEVSRGRSLSSALRESHVLPPLFVSLLSTGERSGELEKTLELLEKTYMAQAERVISFWLRFAEPLAMLVVGAVVALVVLSVVLPLSEISAGVRR